MAGSNREHGFPLGQIKGSDYLYYPGFETGKGGGPPEPEGVGFRYMYWPVKINPFSVRNKKLILLNLSFKVYDDVNLVGEDLVVGNSLDYTVMLAYHKPVNDSIVAADITGAIEIPGAATFPLELIFESENLPQPIQAGYERIAWAIVDLKVLGTFPVFFLDAFPSVQESADILTLMDTTVIDFEERI